MITTRRVFRICAGSLVFTAAFGLAATLALSSERKPSLKPVSKALDQMGSDFCQSFKLSCSTKRKPATKRAGESAFPEIPPVTGKAPAKSAVAAEVPVPRQKPQRSEQAVASAQPSEAPIPRPKPAQAIKSQPSAIIQVAPPPKPDDGPSPETKAGGARVATATDANSCTAQLRNAGVQFDEASTPADRQNCRVELPVRLRAVETKAGRIALPEQPLLNCQFALQFSLWLSDAAAPGFAMQKNSNLAKVATGPGYVCRGRNGEMSSKLSEHATGNAVDITTFTLQDGKTIQVSDAMNQTATSNQLLRGLRTTACGYFSTVLGPGSNAAHAAHFHFDMGRHGKSASYRICE